MWTMGCGGPADEGLWAEGQTACGRRDKKRDRAWGGQEGAEYTLAFFCEPKTSLKNSLSRKKMSSPNFQLCSKCDFLKTTR